MSGRDIRIHLPFTRNGEAVIYEMIRDIAGRGSDPRPIGTLGPLEAGHLREMVRRAEDKHSRMMRDRRIAELEQEIAKLRATP